MGWKRIRHFRLPPDCEYIRLGLLCELRRQQSYELHRGVLVDQLREGLSSPRRARFRIGDVNFGLVELGASEYSVGACSHGLLWLCL